MTRICIEGHIETKVTIPCHVDQWIPSEKECQTIQLEKQESDVLHNAGLGKNRRQSASDWWKHIRLHTDTDQYGYGVGRPSDEKTNDNKNHRVSDTLLDGELSSSMSFVQVDRGTTSTMVDLEVCQCEVRHTRIEKVLPFETLWYWWSR